VFTALAESPLVAALGAGDAALVDAVLAEHVGAGTTLAGLGIALGGEGSR
jgi:hypothetical protein